MKVSVAVFDCNADFYKKTTNIKSCKENQKEIEKNK